jgi:hypothetical protein
MQLPNNLFAFGEDTSIYVYEDTYMCPDTSIYVC